MKIRLIWFVFIVVLFGGVEAVSAQPRVSEPLRPKWIQKLPQPTNSTFTYEVESAFAPTLDAAREKCLDGLIAGSGLKNGVVTVSDYKSKKHLSQVWENGKLTERVDYDAHTTTQAQGNEVKLYVEDIAEYWERDRSGDYYLTKLYAKSELGKTPLFDNVELTTHYGARGLWRSVIIPGWGQFYKGSNLKGGLFLGGTALLAGGVVFTENQRSDYRRKIKRTHDVGLINSYSTKADHFATARNLCIGAAAALYLYNLIDALVAPGARRIVVKKRKPLVKDYAVAPSVSADGTPVMAASLIF